MPLEAAFAALTIGDGVARGVVRRARRLCEGHVLHFWRCRFEVRDAAGALLLEGTVTLAPEPAS